jgi:nitroreductase
LHHLSATLKDAVVTFDLESTDRLISTTRAVRKRLDFTRPVPREVVLECLRLGIQAPTGGNTQRWRWLVVDDPEKKMALAELYRRRAEPYMGGFEETPGVPGAGVVNSARFLAVHMHEVPVMVIPCLLDRVSEKPSVEEMTGYFGSIIPAVWSFQLALRSRGLGSAYTTLHLAYEAEAAALLGIPDTVTQAGLVPVAYTVGDEFKPAQRRPVEEITYFNGWKQMT